MARVGAGRSGGLGPLFEAMGAGLVGVAVALAVFGGGAAAAQAEPSLNLARTAIVGAALALAALGAALGDGRARPPGAVVLALGAWLGAEAIALRAAVDPLRGWLRLAEIAEGAALLCALVAVARASEARRRALLALVIASGAAAGGLALKERFVDRPEARAAYARDPAAAGVSEALRADLESRLYADQASGPFLLPNGLGAFGSLTAVAALAALVGAIGAARRRGAPAPGAGSASALASASAPASASASAAAPAATLAPAPVPGPARRSGPAHGLALSSAPATLITVITLGALAALALAAVLLAGQKGAGLGLAAGVFVAGAVAAAAEGRRRAARGLAALAVAATVALATAIVALPGERLERLPGGLSFAVRHEYAEAALRMAEEAPLHGQGPGQFAVHYGRLKADGAEETRHAHQDYLEALAEGGPVALAGLVGLWAALLVGGGAAARAHGAADGSASAAAASAAAASAAAASAAAASTAARASPPATATGDETPLVPRGDASADAPPPSPHRTPDARATIGAGEPAEPLARRARGGGASATPLYVGVAVGCMALPLLGMPYRDVALAAVLALGVPAAAIACARALAAVPARWLLAGALGTAGAFAAQAHIDFLHREPGILAAALAGGAAAAGWAGAAAARARPAARRAASPLDRGVWGALAAAGAALLGGVTLVGLPPVVEADLARLEAEAALARGDGVVAIEALQRAHARLPMDPGPLVALGDLAASAYEDSADDRLAVEAIGLYRRALGARTDLAWVARRVGDLEAARGRPAEAVRWLERAARADPGHPRHRLALAEALLSAGRPAEAAHEAGEALRLSPLQRTLRNRLDAEERALAEGIALGAGGPP